MVSQLTRPQAHLIWVRGNRGPEPQRWLGELNLGERQETAVRVLQVIPLTEAQSYLTLEQLAQTFPCKVRPE